MTNLLNRTNAQQAIRFFDICFKQGVIDAYEFGNDIDAKEFYDSKREDWSFGVLGQPDDFDWHMFSHQLYWWARRNKLKNLAEGYIFRIKVKNYLWCIIPYCMRFYLLGISEWLKYPNPSGMTLFKKSARMHWDPNCEVKSFSRVDVFSYLHEFEFEYRRLPEEDMPISAITMGSFVQALFDLSRKYVIREEEEDIPPGT